MTQTLVGTSPRSQRTAALAKRKFFLLFLFLLGSLFLYPYAENNTLGYYAFRVLGSAAIVISVYAVSFRRSLVVIAVLLAIPAFLQHALNFRADAGSLSILNIVLSLYSTYSLSWSSSAGSFPMSNPIRKPSSGRCASICW
jgi:hypothetical protein